MFWFFKGSLLFDHSTKQQVKAELILVRIAIQQTLSLLTLEFNYQILSKLFKAGYGSFRKIKRLFIWIVIYRLYQLNNSWQVSNYKKIYDQEFILGVF